jgi:hypothetical protein
MADEGRRPDPVPDLLVGEQLRALLEEHLQQQECFLREGDFSSAAPEHVRLRVQGVLIEAKTGHEVQPILGSPARRFQQKVNISRTPWGAEDQ